MALNKFVWRHQICQNLYGATKIYMAPYKLFYKAPYKLLWRHQICMALNKFVWRHQIWQFCMAPYKYFYSATKICMALNKFVWRNQFFCMAPYKLLWHHNVWRHSIRMTLGSPKFVWLHHEDGIKAMYKSSSHQGEKQRHLLSSQHQGAIL